MDMEMDKLAIVTTFLHNIVVYNIPLLYGTTGEIVVEKSGSLNLGVEGIMAVGAIFGYLAGCYANSLGAGILTAFLMGALVFLYLKYTKHGYEIAVVGDSAGTARYAGMKVGRIVLRTVFLSACLIGLAAAFKVGTAGILSAAITDDVGWTGIIVAWLAKMSTAGIFLVSALISMLQYGSTAAAATFSQVDSSFADMLQGIILFLVLAADFFTRFRVVRTVKGGAVHGHGNG